MKYVQGADYLEKVIAPQSGEMLNYAAHSAGDAGWLLDREDLIIDGQKYTARYTFDASNRIAQEQVEYQNTAACDHLISMTAGYTYAGDSLQSVKIHGGYDGFASYRVKSEWKNEVLPQGQVQVQALLTAAPEAAAAIWRYLLDVELTTSVQIYNRPLDDPIRSREELKDAGLARREHYLARRRRAAAA